MNNNERLTVLYNLENECNRNKQRKVKAVLCAVASAACSIGAILLGPSGMFLGVAGLIWAGNTIFQLVKYKESCDKIDNYNDELEAIENNRNNMVV